MSQTCYVLEKRPNPDLLSLVIPIYNEEEVFPLLLGRLKSLLEKLPCPAEVVLVNDGSRDGSIHQLLAAAREDSRFKVVSLARNFGHQIAATAGLDHAVGNVVVLMDADLQDPPEVVLEMIAKYCEGYDVVYARRLTREGETWFKKATAWGFYRFMRRLIHKDLPIDVGDFRLMSRPCLDALISMREMHRFLRGMVTWIGFAQTEVNFHRPARAAGETKYPFSKMLLFAWNAAISFSPLPLRLCFSVGLIFAVLSFSYGCFAVFAVLAHWDIARGWASSIAFTGFTGGIVLMSIGILGEYVGRIFEEVKGRPLYVVGRLANIAPRTIPPPQ
jgi:glycosyltransferase involved in cell wall biosynthesis